MNNGNSNDYSWMRYDITFCEHPCDNTDCERNTKHLDGMSAPRIVSMAELYGTDLCPLTGSKGENE